MSNIIFLNRNFLQIDRVQKFLRDCAPQHDWKSLVDVGQLYFAPSTMYCRTSVNSLPFKNIISELTHSQVPVLEDFSDTFEQVTDGACVDLWNTYRDRPWIVGWSGGIDSTVIVCSILRNLSVADRSNISIACNTASVYEYPWFYHNVIKPNFHILPAETFTNQKRSKGFYVIRGDPADRLLAPPVFDNLNVGQNMFSQADDLIQYLTAKTNVTAAKWFYKQVIHNLQSQNLCLETYNDFFWWANFSFNWIGVLLRCIDTSWMYQGANSWYLDPVINWFETKAYQNWAYTQGRLWVTKNLLEYKKDYKSYIYQYIGDAYYSTFKTKIGSSSTRIPDFPGACVLDDWSILTVRDLDRILELLPEHVDQQTSYS